MRIIISSNIPGAGKSTAAKFLVDNYDYKEVTFADGIYKIARELFGMKEKDRKLLQLIGEKMREIDPDIWVKDAMNQCNNLRFMGYENIVISDMRRENEYDAAILNEFLPVRINVAEDDAIKRIIARDGKCDTSLLHNQSESDAILPLPMVNIDNNGEVDKLYEQIESLLKDDWDAMQNIMKCTIQYKNDMKDRRIIDESCNC